MANGELTGTKRRRDASTSCVRSKAARSLLVVRHSCGGTHPLCSIACEAKVKEVHLVPGTCSPCTCGPQNESYVGDSRDPEGLVMTSALKHASKQESVEISLVTKSCG